MAASALSCGSQLVTITVSKPSIGGHSGSDGAYANGANGFFVSYPNDPFYKGEDYRSIYFPITRECREHIENCVLEKYQAAVSSVAP